jgi:hypothetical protein
MASASLALSGAIAVTLWAKAYAGDGDPRLLPLIVSAVVAAGSVLWVLWAFLSTVTLNETTIELRNLFDRKSLPLSAIRGRRTYVVDGGDEGGGSTTYMKVVPDDGRLPTLTFQKDYNFDAAFHEWFNSLPDLDALDKRRTKHSNFVLV